MEHLGVRLGRRSGSRSRPGAGTSATKRPRTGLPKSRSRRPGRRPRRGCWSAGTQPSAATCRADAAGPAHAPLELGRAFGPQPAGRRIFSSNRPWSFRCLQTRSEHDQSGLLQRTRRSTSRAVSTALGMSPICLAPRAEISAGVAERERRGAESEGDHRSIPGLVLRGRSLFDCAYCCAEQRVDRLSKLIMFSLTK